MGVNQRSLIVMTDDEVARFIEERRTATMATNGPTGIPHLVAMWYGIVDGKICFETKTKSQKVKNLRRDPRIACMLEAGLTYDQLRGVSVEGVADVIDDPDAPEFWACGVSMYERYHGPYSEDKRPIVEKLLYKRVVVRINPQRVRSWDHRKLDAPVMPVGGTTAQYLDR